MANFTFTFCNINYIDNGKGYYYRVQDGKKARISKEIYDEALYEYTRDQAEEAEIEQAKADAEYEARIEKQAADDKATEDTFNGKKSAGEKKPAKKAKRAKKNVAYTIEFDGEAITLTEKQKIFFDNLPNDDFFEHGEDSALWIDVYCDTLAGIMNAMVYGAMISTLREKGIIRVIQDKINGKKCKFFEFTELGKAILKDMGLV